MITKEQLKQQVEATKEKPVKGLILGLKRVVSETTKDGIFKGEALTKEEAKKINDVYVIGVSNDNNLNIEVGEILSVERYTVADSIESLVSGYEVALVREHMILTHKSFECVSCETKCEGC